MPGRFDYFIGSLIKFPVVLVVFLLAIYLVVIQALGFLVAIVFVFFCGLLLFLKKHKLTAVILFLVIIFTTISLKNKVFSLSSDYFLKFHNENLPEKHVTVEGKVVSYPYLHNNQLMFSLIPEFLNNYSAIDYSGFIRVRAPAYFQVNKGDSVKIAGTLQLPGIINGFDYGAYLKISDIYAEIIQVADIQILNREQDLFAGQVSALRQILVAGLQKSLPEPHASLVSGMLIGTREDLPGGFSRSLQLTGTTHIIAVSGFNVTVIAMFFQGFAGLIPRRKLLVIVAVFLLFYLMLVGSENAPALRATIMAWANLLGKLSGRNGAVGNLLSLACLLMLMGNPLLLQSLSFQLTFGATLGLVFLSSHLQEIFRKFLPLFIAEGLAVTLSATLATFPCSYSRFGRLTVWSPLANILITPLVPVIMLLGFLLGMTNMLFPWATGITAAITWLVTNLLVAIIRFISNLPLADWTVDNNLPVISLIFAVLLVFIAMEINYRKYLKTLS